MAAGLFIALIFTQLHKPITLEIGIFAGSNWDVDSANSYVIIDKAIERFEEENPGVKVHYYSGIRREDYSEWFSEKLLEGEAPDVFFVLSEDFNQFAEAGVMKNIDQYLQKDEGIELDDFYETALMSGTYNGHQYALPYETVPTLMFVNRTLLEQNGIGVPENDWTWEDLSGICGKITRDTDGDGTIDQFGICNYDWLDAAFSNGATIFNEDGTECFLKDPSVTESIKYIKSLRELNGGSLATTDDFDAGSVAFMPLPFAEYRTYKTYPYKIKKYTKFKWDCITMPAGPNGGNTSEISTLLMGISAASKHEELAYSFLKLMTSDPEIQMNIFEYSQGVSALKAVTESKEAEEILQMDMEKNEKFIDNHLVGNVIEGGAVTPKFQKYEGAITLADSEINSMLDGNSNIDNSIRILQQKVTQYLRR